MRTVRLAGASRCGCGPDRFSSCGVQSGARIQRGQSGDCRAVLLFRKAQFIEFLEVEPELPRRAEKNAPGAGPCRR